MSKTIAERIYDIMARDDYEPRMQYCEQMERDCCDNKQDLINVLRNHPQWDEENLRIHFRWDIERPQDTRVAADRLYCLCQDLIDYIYPKCRSFRTKANRIGYHHSSAPMQELYAIDFLPDPDAVETYSGIVRDMAQVEALHYIARAICDNTSCFTETYISEESVERVNSRFAAQFSCNALVPKLRLHSGQKSTKAVWKLLQQFGFDTLLTPDQKTACLRYYSAYTDAMNPLTVERHTVLSVNPVDFLLMSRGNSWQSCHLIGDGGRDHGCYSAGCFSYAYDTQSMIFYTVDGNVADEDIENAGKTTRQIVFWNGMTLLGSRVYPQEWDGDSQIYTQHRQIVEKIMADALGAPNFWRKVPQDCISYHSYGSHYRDYEVTRYPAYEIVGREPDNPESATRHFSIGSNDPICLCCGNFLDEDSCPVCSECERSNRHECECCGDMTDEDDLYEVIDHYGDTIYVCSFCRDNNYIRCDYDDEYHPDDEVTYVEHYGYVYDGDLENSGDFAQCEDCGDWVYVGSDSEDYAEVIGFGYVCADCLDNGNYFQCADCGDWFLCGDNTEYIDETNGDQLCQYCYDSRLDRRNAEQNEQAEHTEEVAA